ncbi:glycoside hydrolase family protein [Galbibacter mesophilus]|uniref:glycosyl hydrolase family 43 n=1 Tax=Galbibacter mesophilus TaxID=379069 RepID=UPI00191D9307|nr:glycosyl hydrolase family 43 [Galbibacter mesophilus]MCM5661804.1 glycosyl hydrolase family 43 [Galbibacter mesophilus]
MKNINAYIKSVNISLVVTLLVFLISSCNAQEEEIGGYLFAHMTKQDYGGLYYSISKDGVKWKALNEGNRIDSLYRGHPDIAQGRNGNYYMIGFKGESEKPVLWQSNGLLSWNISKNIPEEVFLDTPGYLANPGWLGAPKMFFDKASDQYIICWHAQKEGTSGRERWTSMRTFYALSKDLETFSKPARLFDFDTEADREMATIDVIIRKNDDGYFAVIKDERWPDECETGKTIRLSYSKNLTGPYSNPTSPITPSWFEAPAIVPGTNDAKWYLFAEQYPNRYNLFKSDSLKGKWQKPIDIKMDGVRHGCVIVLNENQYNKLLSKF